MGELKECKERICALQDGINKLMGECEQVLTEELLRMSQELDQVLNQWRRLTTSSREELWGPGQTGRNPGSR